MIPPSWHAADGESHDLRSSTSYPSEAIAATADSPIPLHRRNLRLIDSAGVRLAAAGGAVLLASLGAVIAQTPFVLTAAFLSTAAVVTRLQFVLPPGWVIVVLLYVIAPLGALLREIDAVGLVLVLALAAVMPFVVATAVGHRRRVLPRLALLAPLASLALIAIASLTWSPTPEYGSDKTLLFVTTGIIPAAFVLVLRSATGRVGWTPIALGAMATAAATLIFADSNYPPTLFGTNPIWASRGVLLGALVVLFAPFPLVGKLVAVPVMIAAGLSTGSLGPLVGLGAGVIAGVLESLRQSGGRTGRAAIGWIGLAAGVFSVAAALVSGLADPLLASVYDDPNVDARAQYLAAAWEAFVEAPVFGIGVGGFAASGLAGGDYPHNLVAEVAVELGYVGLVLLLLWTALALRSAAGSGVMMAIVVGTLAFSLFSGHIGSNTEFWVCTALAIAGSPLLRSDRGAR
jgi:O-antigen ligase